MPDLALILVWWLYIALLGALAFPLAFRLFRFLPDRGLGFSKALALLGTSYTIWLLGFIHYSPVSIGLVWLGLAGLAFWLWKQDGPQIQAFLKAQSSLVLLYEGLFFCLFLVWALVRMHHPEVVDQEKFMDFAFFNSIARETRFPPFDPWLSGEGRYINYYYFGYFIFTSFSRMTLVDPSLGYNLVIALIFALSGGGIFSIGYNLTRRLLPAFGGLAFLALLGNLHPVLQLVRSSPNPLSWWFPGPGVGINWWDPTRIIRDVPLAAGGYLNHWWDSASPAVLNAHGLPLEAARDAAISEFPIFTFLHGDMHPHLAALPFAILVLGLCLNLLRDPRPEPVSFKGPKGLAPLLPLGLGLGCLVMMNTWDLPAYGLTASLCFLAHQHQKGRLKDPRAWAMDWFFPSALLLVLALLAAAPFLIFFKAPVGGVGLTLAKTGMKDTLTFWGLFLVVLLPFGILRWRQAGRVLAGQEPLPTAEAPAPAKAAKAAAKPKARAALCSKCKSKLREGARFCSQCGHPAPAQEAELEPLPEGLGYDPARSSKAMAALLSALSKPAAILKRPLAQALLWPWLAVLALALALWPAAALAWLLIGLAALAIAGRAEDADGLFAASAMLVGAFFILAVEWIHLKDSFSDSATLVRMNTVFKFYFAAWILLSAAVPFAIARLQDRLPAWLTRSALALVLLLGLLYPLHAGRSVMGNYLRNNAPTLDGSDWLAKRYPLDHRLIQALRKVPGRPVVAEAVGGEYTHYARISSYTGLPCVVGWPGHELQWRKEYPGGQHQDMDRLYTTPDPEEAMQILAKYKVGLVVVGQLEQDRFKDAPAGLAKFEILASQGRIRLYSDQQGARAYSVPEFYLP